MKSFQAYQRDTSLLRTTFSPHYDKAAFMTAQKLGKTVGVSESTVVRFASELGYDGYPALQKGLQELMRNKLTTVQRIEVTSDLMSSDNVLERVLNLDIDKIRRTLEETSKEDFNNAVDTIVSCNTLYIMGTRVQLLSLRSLAYYLGLIFPHVKLVQSTTTSELFEKIMRIDEKDAMIGISFPRYSKQTVKGFEVCKEQRCERYSYNRLKGFAYRKVCRQPASCKKRYGFVR